MSDSLRLPEGYDIVMYEDGFEDGYDLVNPEGHTFVSYRIASELSPGRIALLQEAENRILEGNVHRSILANEADAFYNRARGRVG